MLAVVIPYFKFIFFEETLQSLANQTDKRFKVYIGDDASPDSPKVLLQKYQGQFHFVYHRFETNLGGASLTQQWERCIALSAEERWILVLGDDDVLGYNVVASFYENQEKFYGKSNVIRFASKKIIEEIKIISDIYTHPVWENATASFYRKFMDTTRSSLSEYIFSRETYLKFGFYDYPLAWSSDDRAWFDFPDNKPIFTINESVVFFRSSAFNISGRRDNLRLKNESENAFFKFIILNKFEEYNNEERLRLLRRYQAGLRVYKNLKIVDFFFLLYLYLKYVNVDWIQRFFFKVINKLKSSV